MEERRFTATASRSQQRRRTIPGAAEAAAAWRPWGGVPDNILVRISAFLPCRADRVHMAAVNRLWRNAVLGLRRPPPPVLPPLPAFPPELPWIIFPSTASPTFYNPITDRHQALHFRRRDVPYDIRRARCCGSGDGGWLVLALDLPRAYALYNLNSGDIIPLPDGFVVANRMGTEELLEFDMQAAALWTNNNPEPPYVVAAIVRVVAQGQSTAAAFWIHGGASWFEPVGMPAMVELQDLVWHGNSCFFLTTSEDVIEFWFEQGPNGNAILVHQQYNIPRREDYVMDVRLMHGRIKRYILVSDGGLLMVLRYVYAYPTGAATDLIRVLGLHGPPRINGFLPRQVWVVLHQLAGRMLFLGSGCSRTLEVDHYRYAGFEESMIYFLDERRHITSADGGRQYLFTDMGRYSMGPMTRVPWPPGHPESSDNAPPTWWFH